MRRVTALLLLLGGAACGDRTPPVGPPHVATSAPPSSRASAAPSSSAQPSTPLALPVLPELTVAAEQEGGTNASAVTNTMLLGSSFGTGYQVILQGRVVSQPFIDESAIADRGTPFDFGRWPDELWISQWYLSEAHAENSAGSRIYALRGGVYKQILDDGTHIYVDVWEAPRGCWLGLKSNAWFIGEESSELERVPLRCPSKPRPLSIWRDSSMLLSARGLPDGGLAAVERDSEWLFNPGSSETPSRLVTWDRAGKESSRALPIPPRSAQVKLYGFGLRLSVVAEGALVVTADLSNKPAPGPDRFFEPYAARCDAAACSPLPLPAVAMLIRVQAAEDGALLLLGLDADDAWSLWALPPKGAWRRLGGVPKAWAAARIVALYGSSIDDVWVAVETTEKPIRSALLKSSR